MNEISVIQNVNSSVNNHRVLSGFGGFGGAFPGDMPKPEPNGGGGGGADKPNNSASRTPPLWDLHYDRPSAAVGVKSAAADDRQPNSSCSPQPSPIGAHANHIPQNRTEGLAT